jgi:hypothetical protein
MNKRAKTISQTPTERIANQIVDRLCRRSTYGQSWREFAVAEITRALVDARRRPAHPDHTEVADAAAHP